MKRIKLSPAVMVVVALPICAAFPVESKADSVIFSAFGPDRTYSDSADTRAGAFYPIPACLRFPCSARANMIFLARFGVHRVRSHFIAIFGVR